jgi:hypothetical protein
MTVMIPEMRPSASAPDIFDYHQFSCVFNPSKVSRCEKVGVAGGKWCQADFGRDNAEDRLPS